MTGSEDKITPRIMNLSRCYLMTEIVLSHFLKI